MQLRSVDVNNCVHMTYHLVDLRGNGYRGGYLDTDVNWHRDATRGAHESDDEDWRLTAVFCMRFVPGFDEQIVEALASKTTDIHYEAIVAAGNWELDDAWPHVTALLSSSRTDKRLLLAAIDAAASIRADEAAEALADLLDSEDEDIVAAVDEDLALADSSSSGEHDGDDRCDD